MPKNEFREEPPHGDWPFLDTTALHDLDRAAGPAFFNIAVGIAAALIIAAAFCFFMVAAFAAEWPIDAMNAQIDGANFLVNRGCSGTLIDKTNGYILTANHCIDTQFDVVTKQEIGDDGKVKEVKVRVAQPGTVSQLVFSGPNEVQRTQYVFHIKAADHDHDLALLKVVAKLPEYVVEAKLSCTAPKRGETVYAVGNPFGVLFGTVTKGIVASVARDYRMLGIDDEGDGQSGDNGLMQITAPIEGGNSGGAIYNAIGEQIGVAVRASPVNETVAFAVPLSDLRKFLSENGVPNRCDVSAKDGGAKDTKTDNAGFEE
jgi:S1-C subfamily serine protease